MNRKKTTFALVLAVLFALMLNFYPQSPIQAEFSEGKKSVPTTCMQNGSPDWACNNCKDGTGVCVDKTCLECRPEPE